MINEFYAVTLTSVYRVYVDEGQLPQAQKIALRGGAESKYQVGDHLPSNGPLLAVSHDIEFFRPRRSGERNPNLLNDIYRGAHTSPIAALFLSKEEAIKCLAAEALVPRDARFASQTNAVLNAIGKNHPVFCVCV
jgi:hypothetical protein